MSLTMHELKKYGILICSFIFALCTIFISDNIVVHIVCMLAFCGIQMSIVGFDLMHPYCWFSAFFALYSTGFPIIIAIGLLSRATYSKDVMIYQLVALFVFLLIVGPHKINVDEETWENRFQLDIGFLNKLVYAFTIAVILVAGIYVYRSGYSGKGQIYSEGGLVLNFAFKLPLVLSLIATISFVSEYSMYGKRAIKNLIFPAVALVLITAFSGERDFIFRFILMIMIAMWAMKIIRFKHLLIFVPLMALSIPLSATYKYFFTQGTTAVRAVSSNSILYSIFYGEFESASANLQIILNDSVNTKGKFGLLQIAYDIGSGFYSKIPSTGSWFNQHYYANSRNVQYGFSLVGEGYVIAGLAGIIILFIIIGLITRWYYKHSFDGIYMFGGYIYYITIVIYSIRGDFSNITSALTKQIGLVLLLLYIINQVTKNNGIIRLRR